MSWTQRQDDEVEALGYIIDDGAFTTSPRSTVLPLKLHIKVSLSVIVEWIRVYMAINTVCARWSFIYRVHWQVTDASFDSANPHYCPLIVNITLPHGYPTDSSAVPTLSYDYEYLPNPDCPDVFLVARWLTEMDQILAAKHIEELFDSTQGEVVFEFYEWFKNTIQFPSRQEIRVAESSNTSPSADADTKAKSAAEANHPPLYSDNEPIPCYNVTSSSTVVQHINRLRAGTVACSSKSLADHGFVSSKPFTIKKSTFQGHLIRVECMEDILAAFSVLYGDKGIAKATHNIFVYNLCPSEIESIGFDDDGETAAGNRMAQVFDSFYSRNLLVVVSRWFGGVLLGPSRFKYINTACKEVLEQAGYERKSK